MSVLFCCVSMVTGVIGNVFVLSPLVTIIQGRFTHRLLLAITDDVAKSQDTFRQQYERNGKGDTQYSLLSACSSKPGMLCIDRLSVCDLAV
jgi:hypothetical protein